MEINSIDHQTIYLDWNIFNKLEHLTDLEEEQTNDYKLIDLLLKKQFLIAPYSNAHISDLLRGYVKDPSYTPGHLENITRLTNNICITQYWGEKQVKWHNRDPNEYLQSTIKENDSTSSSFSSLFDSIEDPLLNAVFGLRKLILKSQQVPQAFKQIYTVNPIFNSIYPRTKIQMNMLALCEDLCEFSFKIKNDFTLYKHFKKFLIDSKTKFPQYKKLFNEADNNIIGKPKYLTWDDMWDSLEPKKTSSSNPNYDKIVQLFTTTDFKGYRQDERFANLIDDALHCFYAAHCSFFITIDSRCYDKAKLVYHKLNIDTLVFTPSEFRIWISEQYKILKEQ